MAKEETWYDSQALAAKLITYAALLVLLASVGWAAYLAWEAHQAAQGGGEAYGTAILLAIAGIGSAAFLYGVGAIIDLLIVGCEALRNRR